MYCVYRLPPPRIYKSKKIGCFRLYCLVCYRLFMVCPCCGREFDYYRYQGWCPYCDFASANCENNPEPGFVFFPELLLPSDPLALFDELAYYP